MGQAEIIIYHTTATDRQDMKANNNPIRYTLPGIITYVHGDGRVNAQVFPDANSNAFFVKEISQGTNEGEFEAI